MAPGRKDGSRGLSGLRGESQEIVTLVVDYIKQETLEPVKGLGRYIVFGVAGSVALSIGLAVLAVGFLRLLQGETGSTFSGGAMGGTIRHSRLNSNAWRVPCRVMFL